MTPSKGEVLSALDALSEDIAFRSVAEKLLKDFDDGMADVRPESSTTAGNAAAVYSIKFDTSLASGREPEGMRAALTVLKRLDPNASLIVWLVFTAAKAYLVWLHASKPLAIVGAERRTTPSRTPYQ